MSMPIRRRRGGNANPAGRRAEITFKRSDSGLRAAAVFVYVLAVLVAIGTAYASIWLYTHTVTACSGEVLPCGDKHTLRAAAVGVLVGGLVQVALLVLLARVAAVAAENRDVVAAIREALTSDG